jgi:23S rRNA (uracil1939-C5)-methyltransferase
VSSSQANLSDSIIFTLQPLQTLNGTKASVKMLTFRFQVGTELKIEKLVYGGDGLSRVEGEIVFVPYVLPGEVVTAERTGARKAAQRARLESVAEPSADRVEPRCPVFGKCGGCQYQHATYESQLRIKRDILTETLQRTGKIRFDPARVVVVPSEPYGYRNRIQLHFEDGRVGYREMGSKKLVPTQVCPIGSPKLNEIVVALNRMVRDRRWPGFLESLEVFTDERHVQWNVLESDRPLAKHFFEWLAEEVPGTVIGPLDYLVNNDEFRVSGQSFFQVNRFLMSSMDEWAIGAARGETAWDLYAGVGLFSVPLARRFKLVTAVEGGRAAAADLEHNARCAGLRIDTARQQTETFLADAEEAPDFVLADPPRSGLEKGSTARLLELEPRTIVIVACDPSTLGRDMALLLTKYEIESLTMLDLFPQTFHIETIAKLVLKD